jgi:hypothetical protein
VNSKTSTAEKPASNRAAVGRSRANSSNSNRIRNQVKPAGNRKSWIKSGARWRNRARSPAPASRAPKNFADVESPSSAPETGLLFGQRLVRPNTAAGGQRSGSGTRSHRPSVLTKRSPFTQRSPMGSITIESAESNLSASAIAALLASSTVLKSPVEAASKVGITPGAGSLAK